MATANRTMFCWGNMAEGQLGLGGIEDDQIFTPRELAAFRGRRVRNMACGVEHTLFLMEDGAVYSCGNNDYGQLGHEKTRRKPGLNCCPFFSPFYESQQGVVKKLRRPGWIDVMMLQFSSLLKHHYRSRISTYMFALKTIQMTLAGFLCSVI